MSENLDDGVEKVVLRAMHIAGIVEVPQQVAEATKKHILKLSNLIESLRVAGVDEQMVCQIISQLLQSYEEELLEVLLALPKGDEK